MPGIEANTYQLACLVTYIQTEALKRSSASCSRVCPGGDHRACLMRDVIPSHPGDACTDISSVCLEPPMVRDMKPDVRNEQQKESPSKCQIENDDRGHVPFQFLQMLCVEFTMHDEKLEKLQMPYDVHTITSPVLIPVSKSQEGCNFILSESLLSQRLRFHAGMMSRSSCF
jgi:hypothetical protein